MVPEDERPALIATIKRRLRHRGPVHAISALTREGLETLVREIWDAVRPEVAPTPSVVRDPRFDELADE